MITVANVPDSYDHFKKVANALLEATQLHLPKYHLELLFVDDSVESKVTSKKINSAYRFDSGYFSVVNNNVFNPNSIGTIRLHTSFQDDICNVNLIEIKVPKSNQQVFLEIAKHIEKNVKDMNIKLSLLE